MSASGLAVVAALAFAWGRCQPASTNVTAPVTFVLAGCFSRTVRWPAVDVEMRAPQERGLIRRAA